MEPPKEKHRRDHSSSYLREWSETRPNHTENWRVIMREACWNLNLHRNRGDISARRQVARLMMCAPGRGRSYFDFLFCCSMMTESSCVASVGHKSSVAPAQPRLNLGRSRNNRSDRWSDNDSRQILTLTKPIPRNTP